MNHTRAIIVLLGTLLVSLAIAAPRPGLATSFSGVPTEFLADAIVVIEASASVGSGPTTEQPVQGTLLRLEKGSLPLGATIVYPANSFGDTVRAGIPTRLFLMRFADRHAYYIIAIQPLAGAQIPPAAQFALLPPTVMLLPWLTGPAPTQRSRVFSAQSSLLPTVTAGGATGAVDLYIVGLAPGGPSGSWATENSFVVGSAWVPIARSAALAATATYNVRYTFTGGEPTGTYLLLALIVPPGLSAQDPRNWIASGVCDRVQPVSTWQPFTNVSTAFPCSPASPSAAARPTCARPPPAAPPWTPTP